MRRHCADVAIIGCGLIGSVAAHCLLRAGASVIVVDAGWPATVPPGSHLRNVPACAADRGFYHELVRAHLRPASITRPADGTPEGSAPMPEGNGINAAQRVARNMAAASVTTVFGGMGTLWNGVAPRLDPDRERWPGIRTAEWDPLYERAEAILGVGLDASAGSRRQDFVLRALAGNPGAKAAPVAARPVPGHAPRWTGPAEILAPGISGSPVISGSLEILTQHAVRRLRHRGGRVLAADAVDLATATPATISASVFLVATGAIRTPALLWASGIGTEDGEKSPLGRYLSDHPVAYGQVVLPAEAVAGDDDRSDPDPFVLIEMTAGRPFHSLLLCDGYDVRVIEGRVDDRLLLSLYWYTRAEPRYDNRVVFGGRASDALGLPQPTFEYALSPQERELQRGAAEDLRLTGERLGTFLPGRSPRILSPGSSMHVLGTTRMGEAGGGDSVTDTYGAVWGFENLYVGGTGLVPAATVTNPSLAACALAVRSAERIAGGR